MDEEAAMVEVGGREPRIRAERGANAGSTMSNSSAGAAGSGIPSLIPSSVRGSFYCLRLTVNLS